MSSRPFSRDERDEILGASARRAYDLVVVGGGITGAAIARDGAMRGLRVALVEKEDLGAGTSSRSSKLVHGGLRYLQHLELRLVFEATRERAVLLRIAPHLVRPLPFLFPVYRGDPDGLAVIDAGMWLYDALSRFTAPRLHQSVRGAETLAREPRLAPTGLVGAGIYYDAGTDDTRLTLATAISAWRHGADVLTYARATRLTRGRGGIDGIEVEDLLTGSAHRLAARVVVNATGPWTDRTRALGGRPSKAMLRPTKGVHLVVPWARLPVRHAVVLRGPEDRRVMFAIPWGLHTYVGTTDTDYEGDFDRIAASPEDARYLLHVVDRYFPECRLGLQDIVSSWAGLRPLIHADTASASDVSREHEVRVDEDGLVTIAGGKLTTHRRMASEVLAEVARALGRHSIRVGGCRTDREALPGGEERVETPEMRELAAALPERAAEQLADVHGGEWPDVARLAAQDPSLARPIVPGLPYLMVEVEHAMRREGALRLADVLARRTQVLLRADDRGLGAAPAVADRMAAYLGWDEARREAELAAYRRLAADAVAFRGGDDDQERMRRASSDSSTAA